MATAKKSAPKKITGTRTSGKAAATKKPAATKSAARAVKTAAAKKTTSTKTAAKSEAAPKKAVAKAVAAKAPRGRKYSPQASEDVREELHEMHKGQLHIGRSDKKVTNPKQAIAIGLARARREGAKVPPNPNTGR